MHLNALPYNEAIGKKEARHETHKKQSGINYW